MTIKSPLHPSLQRGYASIGLWAAVLFPALIAASILFLQRLPFPYQDDYKGLLAFADQYHHAPGVWAKGSQIAFFQYNSYRLIFEHGVVCLNLAVTHHLNFGFLTAVGDLFILGIFALLWLSFRYFNKNIGLLSFLPVSLMFFSLTYWETLNWAEAGLQNVPVIFFALGSLQLLVKSISKPLASPRSRAACLIFSCIAAFLCACSSPNGFLLAPVGVLFLLSRRHLWQACVWPLSFLLPFLAYLDHPVFEPASHAPVSHKLFYFAFFFGGVLWSRPLGFLLGVVLLVAFAWAAYARFAEHSPVLFFFALWILLTGGLVEAIRASGGSRYNLYSVLLLICCYEFVLRRLNQESFTLEGIALPRQTLGKPAFVTHRNFVAASIALSLCLFLSASVWAYHSLEARRNMTIDGLRFYRADPLKNSPQANPVIDVLYPDEKPFELSILKRVSQDGLYTVPANADLR